MQMWWQQFLISFVSDSHFAWSSQCPWDFHSGCQKCRLFPDSVSSICSGFTFHPSHPCRFALCLPFGCSQMWIHLNTSLKARGEWSQSLCRPVLSLPGLRSTVAVLHRIHSSWHAPSPNSTAPTALSGFPNVPSCPDQSLHGNSSLAVTSFMMYHNPCCVPLDFPLLKHS